MYLHIGLCMNVSYIYTEIFKEKTIFIINVFTNQCILHIIYAWNSQEQKLVGTKIKNCYSDKRYLKKQNKTEKNKLYLTSYLQVKY